MEEPCGTSLLEIEGENQCKPTWLDTTRPE